MSFEPPNRVEYFSGEWCEVGAERAGVRLALRAVSEAVDVCGNRDVRGDARLAEALQYLHGKMSRPVGIAALRRALDLKSPAQRVQAALMAYERICRGLGQLMAE